MIGDKNYRETGAREVNSNEHTDAHNEVSQNAAKNRRPTGSGLTRPQNETDEKTRQSDGQNPSGSVAIEQVAGAGLGIAKHSKDAKLVREKRGERS